MNNRLVIAPIALLLALPTACTDPGGSPSPGDPSTQQSVTGAAPSIAGLSMRGAPPDGGTTVLIVGLDLDPAATVTYDGVPATAIASCSTSCTSAPYVGLITTTPPHAEGYVDLVVSNPDGQGATFPGFHYGPAPVITGFAPTAVRKRSDLTIGGNDFGATPQVNIGGQIAAIKTASATQLVVTVPKLTVGSYQLSVANPDGQYGVGPGVLTIVN